MLSDKNLLNGGAENSNSEDSERNRIKNLIKNFELEDMSSGTIESTDSQPSGPVRFVLDINNSHSMEENYTNMQGEAREFNYTNSENSAAPIAFSLHADNSMIANNSMVADNRIIEEYERVSENPFEEPASRSQNSFSLENTFEEPVSQSQNSFSLENIFEEPVSQSQNSFSLENTFEEPANPNPSQNLFDTENSDRFSRNAEVLERARANDEALRDFSLTKLENISDKAEKNALVFSYIKIITEMASELEEKRFLANACNNNDIAQAKVIGGVTYINYAATVHIYNMVKDDIRKNKLASAKSGLKLICFASLDAKYVNRAINMLKGSNICSDYELTDIINKTIEKEKILIDTIKQLRRIMSDVS